MTTADTRLAAAAPRLVPVHDSAGLGIEPRTRPLTENEQQSRAGNRTIGLPDPVIALLKDHRKKQDAEREAARQLWHEEGWVFTKPDGRPLNPNTDYREWKELLKEAGLRDARLHDARHTAATVLLILGVPTPTAMAIMGWSSAAMARRYQHLIDSIRRDVARQVGGLLWVSPPDGVTPQGEVGGREA